MSVHKCIFRIHIIFYHMRSFNKTTATLVRPLPFSTLCPTPLGKSPVWLRQTSQAAFAASSFSSWLCNIQRHISIDKKYIWINSKGFVAIECRCSQARGSFLCRTRTTTQHNPGPGFSVRDLMGSKIYFISTLKDSTEAVTEVHTSQSHMIEFALMLFLMFAKRHHPKN